MLRILTLALASLAAAAMELGPGVARASSMEAPSTGVVPGDWDIDTNQHQTAAHEAESVGAEFFHVDWQSQADGQGQSRITGYVYDDEGQPATNVYLEINMLDADGHEFAHVMRQVRGIVPSPGRAYFDVTVPAAQAYRVGVASFDLVEFGPG